MHTRPSSRAGHVTVWLVLCLGLIITIVALGMEGGRALEERRHTQAAADAAALAAADDLYENFSANAGADPNNTAKNAALASASSNGFPNDGTNSVVTVNIPPQSGDFSGQAGYVEVIVQSYLPSGFSTGLTGGQLEVQARAVGRGQPRKVGVLLLSNFGVGVFSAGGTATVTIPGAPLVVDSYDPLALMLTGTASVTADSVSVGGNVSIAGGAVLNGTLKRGATATTDPLASIAAPNPANYTVQSTALLSYSAAGSVTLQPGIYQGGIQLSGSASVTMMPGVYIIQGGGIQVSGSASLSGSGVMIYNTTGTAAVGPISIAGSGAISLSAPTSGTYQGITIFQDRTVNQGVQITGNGSTQIGGMVYAVAAGISLTGNGSNDLLGSGYISATLQIGGNGSFKIDPGTNRPKIPEICLPE